MNKKIIDLSQAGYGKFTRTRSKWIEALWIIVEFCFITNPIQVSSKLRILLIRVFGGKIGKNVIMRPRVRIKFPWNLEIGDNCWIGEGVWIHNQDKVSIGDNTVISQEAFITTGSHDHYKTMDLITKPVKIGAGVWVTSRSMILLGVSIADNTIITPNSVVHKNITQTGIYGGNPAIFLKERKITD